jgi:hypothetical protein
MRITRSAQALRALLEPVVIARAVIKRFRIGSFDFRLAFDAFERPAYAYGVYYAADLAQRLKLDEISIIEFGVGVGNGLFELEVIAREVSRSRRITLHVFGFDSGQGLPKETDYRDLPYVWRRGGYRMDVNAVESRLSAAKLIIGDVAETVPDFVKSAVGAPIGFISFDLDYYSSTLAAFEVFRGGHDLYLPRVLCYFDNISSDGHFHHSEEGGELLAVREFNEKWQHEKIRADHNLSDMRPFRSNWASKMYVYHRFHHPHYNTYIGRPSH